MAEDTIKSKIIECVDHEYAYKTAKTETENGIKVITDLRKELEKNKGL